jgi:hypothetical protein
VRQGLRGRDFYRPGQARHNHRLPNAEIGDENLMIARHVTALIKDSRT